ncbi:hypothetical protein JRQ81_007977, partial [Phrynocephalus forsythii]
KVNIKKKRKRTSGKESEEDSLIKKKKKNQDRPNYFISVPITNPKIIDGVQALQNTIIQTDNRLSKAMIHYCSLHVTLLVMHLSSEEVIDNVLSRTLLYGNTLGYNPQTEKWYCKINLMLVQSESYGLGLGQETGQRVI